MTKQNKGNHHRCGDVQSKAEQPVGIVSQIHEHPLRRDLAGLKRAGDDMTDEAHQTNTGDNNHQRPSGAAPQRFHGQKKQDAAGNQTVKRQAHLFENEPWILPHHPEGCQQTEHAQHTIQPSKGTRLLDEDQREGESEDKGEKLLGVRRKADRARHIGSPRDRRQSDGSGEDITDNA